MLNSELISLLGSHLHTELGSMLDSGRKYSLKFAVKLSSSGQVIYLAYSRKDPLENGMATHSSILARRIPQTEEPGRLQSMGVTKSWTQLSDIFTFTSHDQSLLCPLRTLPYALYSHSITHTFEKTENVLKSGSYRNPQIAWPCFFLQAGAQSHQPR